jgi:hypothetical protein
VGTVAALICAPVGAPAQEFQMQEAPTPPPLAAGTLAPRTIVFTDHRKDELVDSVTGLIHFADWERARPQQKALLSLFPSFEEPTLPDSSGKTRKRRLHVYVAEARFALAKPVASIDLSKMITLAMLEQLDPSIKHRLIAAADVIPNKDAKSPNRSPKRQWCEGAGPLICIQSRYQLEGRLPTGIMLVNKIRETHKKIADFMEFQSELRLVPQSEIDQATLAKVTGVDTPIAGAIEQNIFYVNQIMQFGKFLRCSSPIRPTPKSRSQPPSSRWRSTASCSRRRRSSRACRSCATSCPRRCSPATAPSTPAIRSAPACRNIPATASRRSPRCWRSETRRHSGASRSDEPGIHNHRRGSGARTEVVDSAFAAMRRPGMTFLGHPRTPTRVVPATGA